MTNLAGRMTAAPEGKIGAAIALVFLMAIFTLTKNTPASWNDIARTATVESLVERGTWTIDGSPWLDQTKDKVFLNGSFYSDKMPLLSLLGAVVYAVVRAVLGASLAPDCAGACGYYWITFVLVGIPAALLIGLFFTYARRAGIPLWSAVVGTLALGLGTMILPFALVFNHHVPAAASLFASFFLLTGRDAPNRGVLFGAGLFAALAISFDVLSGITAASILGIAVLRYRRGLPWLLAGATIPLVITAVLDYQIARTIIPPYMITNGYDYAGSAFPATFGGNGTPDDYAAYAFRMFLGGQGLFAYNPLLLIAISGAIAIIFKRGHALRVEAAFILAGFCALALYLALFTGNLGGVAYGERWYVAAIPVLFTFVFFVPPLGAATRNLAAWIIFLALFALSAFSTFQGAQSPWLYTPPPLQMTRDVNHFPIFGFKWNIKFP
jgi:hypothetical protein